MKKHQIPRPTDAELEILKVLWENGPQTVRFVNDILNETREVGYTTTLKFMQIMHEKGILTRDENQRSHIYKPVIKEHDFKTSIVERMIETAFSGSAAGLVLQALGNHRASKEEIKEIRKILDNLEREGK